jgi:alcohol dehydrogenase class IV
MPTPFNFDAPIPLAFGENRIDKLGRDVGRLAGDEARVVLVSDPGVAAIGLVDRARTILEASGAKVAIYADVRSDPLASSIDAVVDLARRHDGRCVIGLGGGSSLDVAKIAAALAVSGDPVEAYALGAKPLPGDGLAKIGIPTTAGTGSEVTRTSVFSTADRKLWAWGNELRCDLALLDPTLTVGLPPHLTAATGVDAAVHAIEAATNRRRNVVSTAIALAAVRLLKQWLKTAIDTPDNLEARGNVLIAATIAGIAFDVAGVAIAHSLGHAMGELAGVHHGRAVGLALNATMANAAVAVPEVYAQVADALGASVDGRPAAETAALAAPAFDSWLRDLGLRIGLDDHGLSEADAERLTALCFEPENKVMLETDSVDYSPDNLREAAARMLKAA